MGDGHKIEEMFPPWDILAGSTMAGGIMYWSYAHAKEAGLASDEEGTED